MRTLILNFSNNIVNEDSFIPNKKGLTMSCIEICENKVHFKNGLKGQYNAIDDSIKYDNENYSCIKELEKTEYGDRIIYTCDYK